MRAASWLMGMFAAAAMSARSLLPATDMVPRYRTLRIRAPRRTGSRATMSAAAVKRRARKLTAIAREKRRQRRASR